MKTVALSAALALMLLAFQAQASCPNFTGQYACSGGKGKPKTMSLRQYVVNVGTPITVVEQSVQGENSAEEMPANLVLDWQLYNEESTENLNMQRRSKCEGKQLTTQTITVVNPESPGFDGYVAYATTINCSLKNSGKRSLKNSGKRSRKKGPTQNLVCEMSLERVNTDGEKETASTSQTCVRL